MKWEKFQREVVNELILFIMKKYISCIVLILLSLRITPVIAAQDCNKSCKISDAPAPALTEYFTNIEKATSNILEALWEAEPTKSTNIKNERNRVISSLNSLLSFWDYFGSFDFEIALPITNEVPQAVKRDHRHIKRLTEKLSRILKTAEKRATAWVNVKNICDGVSYCKLSDGSARDYLVELIKNNQKIAQLYRSSILDKPFLAKDQNFILVSDDFKWQIRSYYNKDTLSSCSECKGGFLDTIREKIKNISNLQANAKEGIQKWKDAWAMLRWWKATPWYAEKEAALLAWYLESQWISSEQADIIMSNLERYNGGGLSTSNPLDSSAYHAQAQVEAKVKTFRETLLEKFSSGEDKIPIAEIVRVDTQMKDSEEVKKEIASVYEDLLPFSITQDTATQELQWRIIRMHFSLVNAINILGGEIPKAERLCDKQDVGNGKCTGYE